MTEEQFGDGLKACDMFGAFVGNELIGCAGFFMQSGTKMRDRGDPKDHESDTNDVHVGKVL